MCLDFLYAFCGIFLILRKIQHDIENPKISNFMKIRPVGAELFHADRHTNGQTDMTKPIVAFRNSANAPKDKTTTNISQHNLQNQ
jgi:hypothetical protein